MRPVLISLLFLAFAASASAPDARSQSRDEQTIVLPLELMAAQPATLAVLKANGHVASGVKVVLSNGEGVTTDESGRAHFLAPPDAGLMFARIPGAEVREAADVLPQGSSSGSLQVTRIPKFISPESRFAIRGSGFQGDADRNRVEIGEKALLVLASSPVELIVIPPVGALPGPADLVTAEGTTEVAVPITLVDVASDASDVQIHRGKKVTIVLRARGTSESLDLEVRSLSPRVAQFARGDEVRVRTTGGSDNSAMIQLKGLSAGPFSFAVSLEDTSATIDSPVARNFLEAAREIAPPDAANRVEAILKELQGDTVDAAKLRNEVQSIPSQNEPSDFQALIRCALQALAGE